MSNNIGYIRVSTIDQNTARQLDGVNLDKTFEDKVSGATTNRLQLQVCLEYLREGDTLHVHSIDRLARSLKDLESVVKSLTARGITVQFHKEGWKFESGMSATQTFLFQMLGAVAEFERNMIKERQAEGIAKAKTRGVYTGRKPKLSDATMEEVRTKAKAGADRTALAKEYGISRPTLYKIING